MNTNKSYEYAYNELCRIISFVVGVIASVLWFIAMCWIAVTFLEMGWTVAMMVTYTTALATSAIFRWYMRKITRGVLRLVSK